MACKGRICAGLFFLLLAFSYKKYHDISKPLDPPLLNLDAYWGPGEKGDYKEDKSIRPFKIQYSDEVINELSYKLGNTTNLPEPLDGVNFEYGFNTNELKKIIAYWKETYLKHWRKRESFLNSFPQYKTKIQGLDIHFIHIKPETTAKKSIIPIIFFHGWPGSVREFYDFIPKLSSYKIDENAVFEIIVPSLPGYAWSQGSSKVGLSPLEMSVIMRNLMLRLGHEKFYVQGGDWGSFVGSSLASLFPENVLGFHANMCNPRSPIGNLKLFIASFYPSLFIEEKYIHWYFPILPTIKFLLEESGYFHIQATKPDTIGIVLNRNPAGLAAYILEKFSTVTNKEYRKLPDGGLTKYFTYDSLLDNIMIYYLTDSITTSVRIYAEAMSSKYQDLMERVPIKPPSSCSRFRHEIYHTPDFVLKVRYTNLIQTTYHEDGGHFAALQYPELLLNDVVMFIKKIRST